MTQTPAMADGDVSTATEPRLEPKRASRFRLIFIAPVFALVVLICWAFASPVGSSPDDDFHLPSIWCGQGIRAGLCETAPKPTERTIASSLVHASDCYKNRGAISADCQNTEVNFSSSDLIVTDRGNFNGSYPPVYYAVMSVFASTNIVASVIVMRIVNAILFVAVTSLLFFFLPRLRRPTLLWAWLISMVPLGLFIVASNNPSSWAVLGIGSAWIALVGYFESVGWRKWALGATFLVTSIMAAGARGDAAIYVIISVAIVLVLTAKRLRSYWLHAILPLATCVLAVLFYFSSAQSAVVVTGLNDGPANEVQKSAISVLLSNLVNVQSLWAGVFGAWPLGWFDTTMPAIVTYGGIACFVAVAFLGLRSTSRRKATVVVGLAVVLWLLPSYILLRSMNLVGTQVQPRYLLPLIVLMAGLAVLQVSSTRLEFTATQLSFVVFTLVAAQSAAMYYNLRRYIAGSKATSWDLDATAHWWWNIPIGPMAIWVVGSLAFAALVVILVRENVRTRVTV